MSALPPSVVHDTIAGISYWRRTGHGRRLVCLHGIGSNAESFSPLLAELPEDWDVIAWNAPGYGASEPLGADWPVESDYAKALGRFLDALCLDRVTLLGHSLGTLMAAKFAALYPARVTEMILGACACGHGQDPGGKLSDAAAARLAELDDLGARAFAEKRGPRLLADPDGKPEARERVIDAMASVKQPGYGQAVRMLASGQLVKNLKEIRCPTQIIWGDGDVVTPRIQSELASAALGGAPITEISGSGHALHVETPAELSRVILSCLESTNEEPCSDKKEETVQ
ncbi:alpha/beta fold hydrolase [Heliomarina baculiformis]|uniref:alpha/beta fold hydrolase n=1 Tax=Heliomarina baculiformis TaxID=2872036 RepID=UPI001EE30066|nr:alpha/beta hydrolase [Heliomarina baculiformis]